ncbi:hypothetical protein [Streptomyces sp. NPDC048248]|uniref:hypothetical protein n=1 Tax=Streptomyces sp. NPDC048248 TaxID=3365523 RepID=UPI003713B06B
MSAGVMRLGRCVTVVGPSALIVLTGGWLFLGAGPVRTGVVWGALAVVAACVLTLIGYVLTAGRTSPEQAYARALDAVRDAAGRPGAPVPAVLHSSRWTWARITAVAVAVPTALVLSVCLGAADPDRSPTAARIADAHYVIKELPVAAVGNVVRAGSSSRSAATADYTVRLPSAEDAKEVSATFHTETRRGPREVGGTFPVAYVPEQPRLGAVGALTPTEVEAQLAGRTLSRGSSLFAAVGWAVVALAMLCVASPPRGSRRVRSDWVALRATVTGAAEHVEPPSGSDAGKDAKSTSRYKCLTLNTEAGDVPLSLAASHERATPLLVGRAGWLVWDPAATGKKVTADYVADEGWQLPGRVPGAEAARVAAPPRGPVAIDAGRQVRLLEFGSLWPRTVPVSVLLGLLVSVAAAGALLLPADGGWRVWTAMAAVAAPFFVWMFGGLLAPAKAAETKSVVAGEPAA